MKTSLNQVLKDVEQDTKIPEKTKKKILKTIITKIMKK